MTSFQCWDRTWIIIVGVSKVGLCSCNYLVAWCRNCNESHKMPHQLISLSVDLVFPNILLYMKLRIDLIEKYGSEQKTLLVYTPVFAAERWTARWGFSQPSSRCWDHRYDGLAFKTIVIGHCLSPVCSFGRAVVCVSEFVQSEIFVLASSCAWWLSMRKPHEHSVECLCRWFAMSWRTMCCQ